MTENNQYEIYRDPYQMLVLLVGLVAEEKGVEFDFYKVPEYENDTFLLRAVDDEESRTKQTANFVYKKDGTEISWYQFLGRDISCSKDLTRSEYNLMFVDCLASLYKLT